MEILLKDNCSNIDFSLVREYLRQAGMGYYDEDVHRKAFMNSYCTIFAFEGVKMIGFGRAISDGAYQAAIYDVVVLPEYQDRKIGRLILDEILKRISGFNIILYATPSKEGFYEKAGFSLMKTEMARFLNPPAMKEKGMI